ncbi:MAG: hypothetical protein NY202_03295 [Mollicutes bacterium UO1]
MARDKSDIMRNIGEIKGSYSGGVCIDCGSNFPIGSQKKVGFYDVCWSCYSKEDNPHTNRVISLIKELER